MQTTPRTYFKRRAFAEITAAMRADTAEASIAHARLAELHMARCADCLAPPTAECDDCPLTNICTKEFPAPERESHADLAVSAHRGRTGHLAPTSEGPAQW